MVRLQRQNALTVLAVGFYSNNSGSHCKECNILFTIEHTGIAAPKMIVAYVEAPVVTAAPAWSPSPTRDLCAILSSPIY